MDRRIVSRLGLGAGLAALLALASGCQNLNTLVTGDKFRVAPKGTPRVEIEVDFVVHDGFYAPLDEVDREALEAKMKASLLAMADLGLRFYPVAADAYDDGDARPERRMLVEVVDLAVEVDEETVEEKGQPLRTEASIAGVTCLVRARVEKRSAGPALVVGTGEAHGRARPDADAMEASGASYGLSTDAASHEDLRVGEHVLLEAFEEGAVESLRAVIKAVDRDLVPASEP